MEETPTKFRLNSHIRLTVIGFLTVTLLAASGFTTERNKEAFLPERVSQEVLNTHMVHASNVYVKNKLFRTVELESQKLIVKASKAKNVERFVNNRSRNAGNRYNEWLKSDRTVEKNSPRHYALMQFAKYGWNHGSEWACLDRLWWHESNWNYKAGDPSGKNAYGIPQAAPGNKMKSAGEDWKDNPETQIAWGLDYIDNRYGTPCKAFNFWKRQAEYGDNGYGWY